MRSRVLIIAGILILGAAIGSTYAFIKLHRDASATAGQPVTSPVISVQVGALKRMTLHRFVTGYGVVAPSPATPQRPAAAVAVAAPVNGVVTKVLVAAGQHVRRGQLLVELDSDAMTEAYAAEEARREQMLYAQHNTSLKALQRAEAQLALLRVTAPISGTVVRVNVKAGSAVNTSTVLAEVFDLKRLIVQTDIPEAQATELEVGQPVQVLGASPIMTRLTYISPTVNTSDGAVEAWARLPAHSHLRPGQYVRLRIVTATHRNTLAAPGAGVITDVARRSVLSIVRGHEAIRVPVRTGLRENGWVEVSGPGLKAGTPIVTVGAYGLPRRVAIQITPASAGHAVTAKAKAAGGAP